MNIITSLALSIVLLASLAGCATTGRQVTEMPVSQKTMSEAQAIVDGTRSTNAMMYQLSVAAMDECKESKTLFRAPFTLLFNPPGIKSEEMRTAIFKVSGANEFPVIQVYTKELAPFAGQRVKSVNQVSANDLGKIQKMVFESALENKAMEILMEDGRTMSTQSTPACPSIVMTDYFGTLKEASNPGTVGEVTPKAWMSVIRNRDEAAFVLARSIYFTGAGGRSALVHAAYLGAAASGLLHGLTFGIGNLIVEPMVVTLRVQRKSHRGDADAFAIRAMKSAGYNPRAALELARRSVEPASAWPNDADELKFDQERLARLALLAN
jgi:hypothetical protein